MEIRRRNGNEETRKPNVNNSSITRAISRSACVRAIECLLVSSLGSRVSGKSCVRGIRAAALDLREGNMLRRRALAAAVITAMGQLTT
jgi:hypothetical protein